MREEVVEAADEVFLQLLEAFESLAEDIQPAAPRRAARSRSTARSICLERSQDALARVSRGRSCQEPAGRAAHPCWINRPDLSSKAISI